MKTLTKKITNKINISYSIENPQNNIVNDQCTFLRTAVQLEENVEIYSSSRNSHVLKELISYYGACKLHLCSFIRIIINDYFDK